MFAKLHAKSHYNDVYVYFYIDKYFFKIECSIDAQTLYAALISSISDVSYYRS